MGWMVGLPLLSPLLQPAYQMPSDDMAGLLVKTHPKLSSDAASMNGQLFLLVTIVSSSLGVTRRPRVF